MKIIEKISEYLISLFPIHLTERSLNYMIPLHPMLRAWLDKEVYYGSRNSYILYVLFFSCIKSFLMILLGIETYFISNYLPEYFEFTIKYAQLTTVLTYIYYYESYFYKTLLIIIGFYIYDIYNFSVYNSIPIYKIFDYYYNLIKLRKHFWDYSSINIEIKDQKNVETKVEYFLDERNNLIVIPRYSKSLYYDNVWMLNNGETYKKLYTFTGSLILFSTDGYEKKVLDSNIIVYYKSCWTSSENIKCNKESSLNPFSKKYLRKYNIRHDLFKNLLEGSYQDLSNYRRKIIPGCLVSYKKYPNYIRYLKDNKEQPKKQIQNLKDCESEDDI